MYGEHLNVECSIRPRLRLRRGEREGLEEEVGGGGGAGERGNCIRDLMCHHPLLKPTVCIFRHQTYVRVYVYVTTCSHVTVEGTLGPSLWLL